MVTKFFPIPALILHHILLEYLTGSFGTDPVLSNFHLERSPNMKHRYGTGRAYKRGGLYWIQYYIDGKRYQESSGSHFKQDAEKLLRQRLEKPVDRKPTMNDLLDRLLEDYAIRKRDVYKTASKLKHVLGTECPTLLTAPASAGSSPLSSREAASMREWGRNGRHGAGRLKGREGV
jgi:hypothetical protein